MRSRAVARALVLGCALVLILPTAISGVTWGPVLPITTSGQAAAWNAALTVTGASGVQLVYREWGEDTYADALLRRSADSGATWKVPIQPVSGLYTTVPAAAATGTSVHVVVRKGLNDGRDRLVYARSDNQGRTWGAPLTIATFSGPASTIPAIAADGAGRVAIAWTSLSGKVQVRVSTNGGSSFGSAQTLATSTRKPYSDTEDVESYPTVAISKGAINVAYYLDADSISLRRTTTNGSSWSPAIGIANNGNGYRPKLAAAGATMLIGYAILTETDIWSAYRRSTNSGATWGDPAALSPASAHWSYQPVLSYRGGIWRAAFERCLDSTECNSSATFYRQSSDGGRTWSSISRVSPSSTPYAWPVGVNASGGKSLVAYMVYDPATEMEDLHVRRGS